MQEPEDDSETDGLEIGKPKKLKGYKGKKTAKTGSEKTTKSVKTGKKKKKAGSHNSELFESLRVVRQEIAKEQKVPAFIIFSDATLEDMCRKVPKTKAAFLDVTGVGETKLERYGDRFLAVIKKHKL